ncbi:MAG: patatin-like phospholipase family protein [Muribaculaceae bacterium]
MKKVGLILSVMLIVAFSATAESVGLVLSGGGAKGIAHIGVIQAFEDNNIPIDYITGTSMGAIVGGMYAIGYTPDEMMELLLSNGFADWSTGVINENLKYYFLKPSQTPAFMHFNLNFGDSTKISTNLLPRSLINPLPMNFAFMELFSAYSAQCDGDFNRLFVPFRCVASDVYNKRKIVCKSGQLGDAIRASMSFPIVFKPIKIDGVIALDGGIYDNFPVDVMREDFAPSIMIGIDVAIGGEKKDDENLIDQIEAMVMQPQDKTIPAKDGMKIDINLQEFGLLDFPKAQAIYQIGYDKAMTMMDSIKTRVHARMPKETRTLKRDIFKSATPEVVFDSVIVTGARPDQNDFIKYMFTDNNHNDTINMAEAKDSFYKAISGGKIKDLIPQAKYNNRNGTFSLNITADVKDNISLGIGGYITSSTNSMIYLSTGFKTLNFHSFDADISGWIGQSYYAGQVNAKVSLTTDVPSYLKLQGVVSQHKFYESDILFYSDELPTYVINYDNFVRLKYGIAVGRNAKFELGVGYGYMKDRFHQNTIVDNLKEQLDEARYNLGQVSATFDMNTLDNQMYPTAGLALDVTAMGVYGNHQYKPRGIDYASFNPCGWGQIECNVSKYYQLDKHFSLGAKIDAMASTKSLLGNYTASLIQAPAFAPTPVTKNYFNPAFRANSFVALGVIPIWKIIDNLQLRTEFYAFMPFQKIKDNGKGDAVYGRWFNDPSFIAEMAAVYNFPFASISIYGNYLSYPARNWNFGVSFGLLFLAPKFLR